MSYWAGLLPCRGGGNALRRLARQQRETMTLAATTERDAFCVRDPDLAREEYAIARAAAQ
jgi:hypothetical protein